MHNYSSLELNRFFDHCSSLYFAITLTQNGVLADELARLQGVCEAQRELVKADAALNKHVVEMEDFEEKSKENRAKALSGEYTLRIYYVLFFEAA